MKIKEIYVGIIYPYQLAPYMYGRVERAELLVVEEGDDPESLKKERFEKMLMEAKKEANEIVCGDVSIEKGEKKREGALESKGVITHTSILPTRKRRF